MIGRTVRGLLRVTAATCLLLAPTAVAGATAGAAPPDAMVRGAHFSPDTPGVDVYLTAFSGGTTTLWLSGVGYGDVSGYERLTPGVYAVAMRMHGAPRSTPAAVSWTLNAGSGKAYTVAAVGMKQDLKGIVLPDDLTPPRRGGASVRVIQAASAAHHVDVVTQGGSTLARGTAFGSETGYTTVRAGTVPLVARSVENPALQARAELSVPAGSVKTIVVLDAAGHGLNLRTLLDAASESAPPVGAVAAGGGGSAIRPAAGTDWLAVSLLVAGALIAVTGLARGLGTRRRE